jgi:ribosomal protein S18 acetylase RimI-like enzyme
VELRPGWRLAEPGDDDRIVELSLRLYEEDPAEAPVPRESVQRTLSVLRAEPIRGRVLVCAGAEPAGRIVGYAIVVSFWSNELGGETCEIDELFVERAFRGMGLGSELLERLADDRTLWPRRPVALSLQVTPDNARARALYERLGFRLRKNSMLVRRT